MKRKDKKQHKNHLINKTIIQIISIYGPNGGGKTSILNSLYLLTNLIFSGNNLQSDARLSLLKWFKNYERQNEPIKWMVEFIDVIGIIYKYELSVSEQINYEKLTYKLSNKQKEKIVFERHNNLEDCIFSTEIKSSRIKFEDVKGAYLNYISRILDIESVTFVIKEFKKIIFLNSLNDNKSKSLYNNNVDLDNLDLDFIKKEKEIFLRVFKETGINIIDLEIRQNGNGLFVFNVIKEDSWGKKQKLPFSKESAGTQKLLKIMHLFLKYMHNDVLFVIDELDSSLHTKLLGYIIKMFSNKKTNNSQLIYTSHDIGTLNKKFFRKDEVYFAALNESNFTNIISLNDFDLQIRDSNSFSKLYLEGKLGYDPYIDYALEWLNVKK